MLCVLLSCSGLCVRWCMFCVVCSVPCFLRCVCGACSVLGVLCCAYVLRDLRCVLCAVR